MNHIRYQLLKSLSKEPAEGLNKPGGKYQAVELLHQLQKKYQTKHWLIDNG